MDAYREIIRENIDYDILLHDHPHDVEQIDGYVELMLEVCCSTRDFIRISKEELPTGVVKARFLKLTREHMLNGRTPVRRARWPDEWVALQRRIKTELHGIRRIC